MKPVPTDPWALQARIMSAMCDDIRDLGAGGFPRLEALRQTMISTRDAGSANNAPATDK